MPSKSENKIRRRITNAVEQSLLTDLAELYRDDMKREKHEKAHHYCLVCTKEKLLDAISRHQEMLEKVFRSR